VALLVYLLDDILLAGATDGMIMKVTASEAFVHESRYDSSLCEYSLRLLLIICC